VKSTPTRGVKQSLKPDAYKQWEGVSIQASGRTWCMSEPQGFERLDVYRRSYAAALRVHALTLSFPEIERFALADQMRRASRSICANVAEGHNRRRGSSSDFRRYLTMAAGSADEMQVWASFARDLSYTEAFTADAMRREYAEIARMLNGLAKAWSDGAPAPDTPDRPEA
jgi:four helix bundle protein